MIETVEFEGMKIGLCQQHCVPADPRRNADAFIREIEAAEKDEVDLLVGVEGLQGYLIGDQYEYPAFLREVDEANHRIGAATVGLRLAVAYGSVLTSWHAKGEDGRVRRYNGGVIFQNGRHLAENIKTLLPNYRMFPESRYFFSYRQIAEQEALRSEKPFRQILSDWIQSTKARRRNGRKYILGQEFCEDMWEDDYAIKPTCILAENGAELIINHSASPWTWRKNNKRHRVIKSLMQSIPSGIRPKLFVYVNRTGIEQSGKNIYIYDGSSAVYDGDGDLIYEVKPYEAGTKVFTFGKQNPKIEPHTPDDTKALYDAMACTIDNFFGAIPEERRFVYVGLSGGIDSSAVASLLVSRPCLGKDRVIGVNMPYGRYNCREGKDDARLLAKNLGIPYLVIDITESVDQIAKATGVTPDTDAFENIQARVRMEILAALSQKQETIRGLVKKGGLFTANGNKDEMCFGYGTLYGDIAGVIMLLAELVKREVYQIADFCNRAVFGWKVIPQSIFERQPTAELKDQEHKQVDPFFYGNLEHRGYHDEWVRAVTEFRWDPVRFLTEYKNGTLEKTFLLKEGSLKELFPTAGGFIRRFEKDWSDFTRSYFKRDRAPFIPVFTRRAFGGDLLESIYSFPPTEEYLRLKEEILAAEATRETIGLAKLQHKED